MTAPLKFYSFLLAYTREDGTTGAMSTGRRTLEELHNQLAQDSAYYVGLGYTVHPVTIREECGVCSGSGQRPHKGRRQHTLVRCATCKGLGYFREFPADAPSECAPSR